MLAEELKDAIKGEVFTDDASLAKASRDASIFEIKGTTNKYYLGSAVALQTVPAEVRVGNAQFLPTTVINNGAAEFKVTIATTTGVTQGTTITVEATENSNDGSVMYSVTPGRSQSVTLTVCCSQNQPRSSSKRRSS